jgi:hypothetical protein
MHCKRGETGFFRLSRFAVFGRIAVEIGAFSRIQPRLNPV